MEQGTGKTLVTIRRIEKLVKLKRVNNIIIVALSAGVPNWVSELYTFLKEPDKYNIIEYEGKVVKRQQMIKDSKKNNKINILIMNYEKADKDRKWLIKFNPDMLVCDESQKIKNRKAKVTKALSSVSNKCDYCYILTGTPISLGYEDVYGQFLVMNPKLLGTRWKDFEDKFLKLGGFMGKQVDGYRNLKSLKRIIHDNSYIVKKKDCLDLPKVTEQKLYCELSPKARKAYNELDKELMAEFDGLDLGWVYLNNKDLLDTFVKGVHEFSQKDLIVLDNALTKTMKLQQITGGFIKNTETEKTMLIDKSKLNLLIDTVESCNKPLVIFCRYRAEIDTIKATFSKLRVEELSGHTKDKGKVNKDFQKGKYDILVVQIKTGSASINLTKASTAIFYSWSSSYIDVAQAKARLDRIGQTSPVSIIFLVSKNTVDELSLQVLSRREKMSKNLLDKSRKKG
jgi:SNF2 family DNA or RNA helicase